MTDVPANWGKHFEPRELAQLFYSAGWIDTTKLAQAVAVCIAESNGYEKRQHVNSDGSIDRGLWALNSVAHKEIPDSVAYDAKASTAYARGIYVTHGNSFKEWAAFTDGQWKGPRALGYACPGVGNFLLEFYGLPLGSARLKDEAEFKLDNG